MDTQRTEIVYLLDKSNSMTAVQTDMIAGFNSFLTEQRRGAGSCYITLVQFNDLCEPISTKRDINFPALTSATYSPRGSTALLDAICYSIDDTGKRLASMAEEKRPGLVIFIIHTDGYENASRTHNMLAVNERITKQRETYRWKFVLMGTNQDTAEEATKMGIRRGAAITYAATEAGMRRAIAALSANVAKARTGYVAGAPAGAIDAALDFTDAQRKEQLGSKI